MDVDYWMDLDFMRWEERNEMYIFYFNYIN